MLAAGAACCAVLAQSLLNPNQLSRPSSRQYNSSNDAYFSAQEAALSPACILAPPSAGDVAHAVSILAKARCSFAVKSHGHAPAAGFANIQDGVTIDLRALDAVTVSSDTQVASIGAGAAWLDVYAALDARGLTVAGGRNGLVGVGGLLLGGGISYIGPRMGWACDTVVNFEIVLASGRLSNANETYQADLFRALKGGANNFGVVTRFDLQTYAQGEILAGDITSPFTQRRAVFQAFADLANATHYDPYAEIVTGVSWAPGTGWGAVSSLAAYTRPQPEPAALQSFLAVPGTTNSLHITPIHVWANESSIPQFNWLFATGTYSVSAELMEAMVDTWNATLDHAGSIPGLVYLAFAFEPLPTVYTQHSSARGGDSLGLSPADGNAMVLLITIGWSNSLSSALVHDIARQLLADSNRVAISMGLFRPFVYANYAAPFQDPLHSYGPANFAALQAASSKYDPHGVFQRQVPGGFKLFV